MDTGSFEEEEFAINAKSQYPVRFEVAFAVILPIAS
jgi:hypothetical protein